MKKNMIVTLGLFIFVFGMLRVSAATNPYNKSGPYGTNCTWYAWKMASEKGGVNLPGFGNAKNWYDDAKKAGYSVGIEPKDNSIIVWGGWTSYGHVGYVEKVSGNILYVWDSSDFCFDDQDPEYVECMEASYDEQSQRACYNVAKEIACEYTINPDEYGITGYIYLNETPKKKTVNQKSTEEKKEVVKSSNAYLTSISLTTGTIDFKKDIFEYNLEVENDIDTIKVDAKTEDSKSLLVGNDTYNLEVGVNEIKLIVTAEDKTVREYKINVIRKDEEKEKIEQQKEIINEIQEKDNINHNKKIIIILVIIGILGIVTLGSLMIIKLKKKKQ